MNAFFTGKKLYNVHGDLYVVLRKEILDCLFYKSLVEDKIALGDRHLFDSEFKHHYPQLI